MSDDQTVRVKQRIEADFIITDPAALIASRQAEWDDLTDDEVIARGYRPYERFTVFLNDIVDNCEADEFGSLPGVSENYSHVEYDWRWTPERADRLTDLLAGGPAPQCEGQTALL